MLIVFGIIYLVFAILVGLYAKKTYMGFIGGFLISLLITPLLMAVILQLFRIVKTLD